MKFSYPTRPLIHDRQQYAQDEARMLKIVWDSRNWANGIEYGKLRRLDLFSCVPVAAAVRAHALTSSRSKTPASSCPRTTACARSLSRTRPIRRGGTAGPSRAPSPVCATSSSRSRRYRRLASRALSRRLSIPRTTTRCHRPGRGQTLGRCVGDVLAPARGALLVFAQRHQN